MARHTTSTITTYKDDFPRRRAAFWDCILLFTASFAFFLYNIQYPATKNFDEFHYIPSALQWIALSENQNWEHPPFAKILISIGIRIFGDEPLGWRFMSVVFGALTLVGMYRIAYELFGRSRQAAWYCAILTLFNQLLYVQSRIAMLDTFMMGFLSWSLWSLVKALDEDTYNAKHVFRAGLFMGLSVACKWFSLVPWTMGGGLLLLQAVRFRSRERFIDILVYWIAVPLVAYYVTFLPYLLVSRDPGYTLWELLTDFQTRMLDGQKRVVNSHPYMSQFWDWIVMRRPIWYAFDKEGSQQETVRGVLLLGNPVIMWGGLVAIAGVTVEAIRRKSWRAFLIAYFYFGFAFCWIAIPRKIAFYYYYYPAGMILGLAFTYWMLKIRQKWMPFVVLGVVAGFFVYFFPILAALPIPSNGFMQWMWFQSWI
ncbi:MAG: glycosyltransferase family 39 protein [Bdellovibrionales bacterium]|nr:glycosyltransferase family 39 protein [Bdellovibrionales bacterium]